MGREKREPQSAGHVASCCATNTQDEETEPHSAGLVASCSVTNTLEEVSYADSTGGEILGAYLFYAQTKKKSRPSERIPEYMSFTCSSESDRGTAQLENQRWY
jgi:hypothetical protein